MCTVASWTGTGSVSHWAGSTGQGQEVGRGSGPVMITSPSSSFISPKPLYVGKSCLPSWMASPPVEKTLASTGERGVRLKPRPVHTNRSLCLLVPPSLRPGRLSWPACRPRTAAPERVISDLAEVGGLKPRCRRLVGPDPPSIAASRSSTDDEEMESQPASSREPVARGPRGRLQASNWQDGNESAAPASGLSNQPASSPPPRFSIREAPSSQLRRREVVRRAPEPSGAIGDRSAARCTFASVRQSPGGIVSPTRSA